MQRRKLIMYLFALIPILAIKPVAALNTPMYVNPAEVLKLEINYVMQNQLVCGSWINCTLPIYSSYLQLGGQMFPFNSTVARLTVLYMDSQTIGSTDFSNYHSVGEKAPLFRAGMNRPQI